jgi:2-oxoglutarate ferredoxin oxidoreductase subunit gamma
MVKPNPASSLKHVSIPATERAFKDFNNRMVANIVLLGAVVKGAGLVREESLLKSLANRVPPAYLDLNRKAVKLGFELGKT